MSWICLECGCYILIIIWVSEDFLVVDGLIIFKVFFGVSLKLSVYIEGICVLGGMYVVLLIVRYLMGFGKLVIVCWLMGLDRVLLIWL